MALPSLEFELEALEPSELELELEALEVELEVFASLELELVLLDTFEDEVELLAALDEELALLLDWLLLALEFGLTVEAPTLGVKELIIVVTPLSALLTKLLTLFCI